MKTKATRKTGTLKTFLPAQFFLLANNYGDLHFIHQEKAGNLCQYRLHH